MDKKTFFTRVLAREPLCCYYSNKLYCGKPNTTGRIKTKDFIPILQCYRCKDHKYNFDNQDKEEENDNIVRKHAIKYLKKGAIKRVVNQLCCRRGCILSTAEGGNIFTIGELSKKDRLYNPKNKGFIIHKKVLYVYDDISKRYISISTKDIPSKVLSYMMKYIPNDLVYTGSKMLIVY